MFDFFPKGYIHPKFDAFGVCVCVHKTTLARGRLRSLSGENKNTTVKFENWPIMAWRISLLLCCKLAAKFIIINQNWQM